MIKLLLPIISIIPMSAFSSDDWETLIKENKYVELKQKLYTETPNVLERNGSSSIFDLAIENKDKRSAIIVAEYQNFSLKNSEMKTIFERIALLKIELKGESTQNMGEHLKETVDVIENLERRVADMESDGHTIKSQQILAYTEIEDLRKMIIKSNAIDQESVLLIVDKLKSIEGKILSDDEAKAFISASASFINDPAITVSIKE